MRCLSKSLSGAVAMGVLLMPGGLIAQPFGRGEAKELFIEAFRYLQEVRLESKYSDPLIGGIRFSDVVATAPNLDPAALTEVVSLEMGIPIWNRDENRYCDVSGGRPLWQRKTGDLLMSAFLNELPGQTARVSLTYSTGLGLSGRTEFLVLERTGEGWLATGFEDGSIGGTSTGCRPAPPPALTSNNLASMLTAAVIGVLSEAGEEDPNDQGIHLCLQDLLDGWVGDVEEELIRELEQWGFSIDEGCQAGEPIGVETPEGDPTALIIWNHVVFESPERASVQMLVVRLGSPVQSAAAGYRPVQQCIIERTDGLWKMTSCEAIELSQKYPIQIGGG